MSFFPSKSFRIPSISIFSRTGCAKAPGKPPSSGMKEPIFFDQKTFGTIATKPIGNEDGHHWSRLFEIFIPENYSETLAQIGEENYLKWRHDKKIDQYLEKFAEWYVNNKK